MTNVPSDIIEQKLWSAYEFAKHSHAGQIRKSGDPYIIHPVSAALELLILKPDLISIQAALLHDVAEDTEKTVADIEAEFGSDVAHIVSGMEKLSKLKYRGEDREIGSMRKMFIAVSEDLRVILVKLADRIHNMRTLQYHPEANKRERIARETLYIYAPIADRL